MVCVGHAVPLKRSQSTVGPIKELRQSFLSLFLVFLSFILVGKIVDRKGIDKGMMVVGVGG